MARQAESEGATAAPCPHCTDKVSVQPGVRLIRGQDAASGGKFASDGTTPDDTDEVLDEGLATGDEVGAIPFEPPFLDRFADQPEVPQART
jgi:hypothetical protein